MHLILDKVFGKDTACLEAGEYVGCRFTGCELSGADLSGSVFTECRFEGCNLSLAKLRGTAFRDTVFKGCKMLGLQISDCNPLGLSFTVENSICDNWAMIGVKLPGAIFRDSRFREADFSECDLSGASITGCDLTGAVFESANIEKADLRESVGYSIDPTKTRIRKAHFSLPQVAGLLYTWDIRLD